MMTSEGQTTNQLIHETSPYLLQHAHNPVDWHPWGAEAFALAKYENKPLLISIGYSACHWCHVMERESFTNSEVASMMNEHFVCIKVDREERPDVDQVYMDAVRMINGKGGWPLNCFALPDGRPFWGATYFQPEQLIQVLDRIAFLWRNQQDEVISQAEILSQGIREQELNITTATRHHELESEVEKTFMSLLALLDLQKGGLKGTPKFPMPVVYSYLLRWGAYSGQREVCTPVWTTLDHMACGGIYDQLGGGFSRYSVDEDWRAPHFEKMLYDNAQLALLYMEGWQVSGNPLYRTIAEETLAFVQRELTSPEGAFLSALDADSEGEEGRFYVWKLQEFRRVLGCDSGVFMRWFGLGKSANWENDYHILQRPVDEVQFLAQEGIDADEWKEKLTKAKKTLYDYRSLRPSPNLDDKVLTSWNALMMKSYAEAAIGLDRPDYLEIAEKNARFILDHMIDAQGRLMHSFKNGKAKINGFLEDYAYAIDAFLSLYQATFHYPYLLQARDWAHYAIEHFYDEEKGLFFFTSDEDTPLVARLFELNDGVMPSPNSVMARSLIRLAVYFEKGKYRDLVLKAIDVMGDLPVKYSASFSNWSILWLEMLKGPASAVFGGAACMTLRKELGKSFLPFVVMAAIHPGLPLTAAHRQQEQAKVYICSDNQCFPPTDSVKEMEELLHGVD